MLSLDLLPRSVIVNRRPRAERGDRRAAELAIVRVGVEPLGRPLAPAAGAVVIPRAPASAAGSGPSGPRLPVDFFFHHSSVTAETDYGGGETALNQLRRLSSRIIPHFSKSCFSVSVPYMRFYRIEEHQVTLTKARKESHTSLDSPKQSKQHNLLACREMRAIGLKLNAETADSGRFRPVSRSSGELWPK